MSQKIRNALLKTEGSVNALINVLNMIKLREDTEKIVLTKLEVVDIIIRDLKEHKKTIEECEKAFKCFEE